MSKRDSKARQQAVSNGWPCSGLPSKVICDNGTDFHSSNVLVEVEMDQDLRELLSVDVDGNRVAPPVMLVRRQ